MGDHTSIKSSRKTLNVLIENFEKHQRPSIERDWNFQSILSDIHKFENRNSSIFVNVFGFEKLVYRLRISKHNYKRESTVNLLLISEDTKQHYCWIKDISKLLSLQTSKHDHVGHVCFRCLNTFNSEKALASHHEYYKSCEDKKFNFPKRDRNIF